MKADYPIIPVEKVVLSDNYYTCGNCSYDVPTMIEFCKEKKYETFDMPLAGLNISIMPYEIENMNVLAWHCKRVFDCSLDHPIILDVNGSIADGTHRVIKALIEGRKTIKAIRMLEMPKVSYTSTGNEK